MGGSVMKTAFLVCFCPMTRAVIDVKDPNNLTDEEYESLAEIARERMLNFGIEGYLNAENLDFDGTRPDTEIPYGCHVEDNA